MQEISEVTRQYRQSIIRGVLIGVCIGLVFTAGFLFRGLVELPPTRAAALTENLLNYPLLDEVQSLLNQHYVRPQPDPQIREYGAIRGMLSTLNDRFTFFIDPPVAQSESDVLAGTYGGIGVQVQRSEKGDLVLYPFVDSPALTAGVSGGDILVAINQVSVDITMQQDAIDQLLRGEVKDRNGVEITFVKQVDGDRVSVFIPFSVINVPSVIWRILPENAQIGYVQIVLFTSRTPDELKEALEDLISKKIDTLILDLRNNSGGLLQESVQVAAQFLDGGVVVYEKTQENEHALDAEFGGLATAIPLVVLVNQGTASAAELVAGAIRDRERGILIGQTTYGKGTVQQIFRLSDDSSLHITSAEWLTPNRQQIDGTGLEPNIPMIPDANGRDVELGEAIRYLEQLPQKQDS